MAIKATLMPKHQLFLIRANKSRPPGKWSADDYDMRDGAPYGPVIGRIYKLSIARHVLSVCRGKFSAEKFWRSGLHLQARASLGGGRGWVGIAVTRGFERLPKLIYSPGGHRRRAWHRRDQAELF